MKKLLIPLIAAGSLLYLPASHAEDPCKVIMCMAGKLTGDSGGSECNSAEASVTVLKLLSSISLKRTSTAFYPTTRRMLGRLFLMNARIMAKVEVTSR